MNSTSLSLYDEKTEYTNLNIVEAPALPEKLSRGARIARFWKDGHRQARIDFRRRWGRTAACLWIAGLLTCFGLLYPFSMVSTDNGTACLPDGSFSLRPDTYRYWSRSGFFDITLGFGKLSFTQAKALDIGWDVIYGRGGQTLLAIASWTVFVDYLTTSMQVRPVTYDTYRAIFIQDQSPSVAIPRMIRDFATRTGLHSTIAMAFMVYAMTLVWVFPTISSAMTAYSGNVKAFINSTDGNLVPFNSFRSLVYTIHDGSRVGVTDEYNMAFVERSRDDPVMVSESDRRSLRTWGRGINCDFITAASKAQDCAFLRQVDDYVNTYLILKEDVPDRYVKNAATETKFGNLTLPSPRLNISIFSNAHNMSLSEINSKVAPENLSLANTMRETLWMSGNQMYNATWLKTNGRCQPTDNYQWGFSFIQLNLMIFLLLIWTFGIMAMWLRAHRLMKTRGYAGVAGRHRAVIELASAMNSQLDRIAATSQGRSLISESDIDNAISQDLHGGSIAYPCSLIPNREHGREAVHWGFWPYVRKNFWWILWFVIFAVGSVVAGFYGALPILIFIVGGSLAILVTLIVGTTPRSRFAIFFWAFWLLFIIPQAIAILALYFSRGSARVGLTYGRQRD